MIEFRNVQKLYKKEKHVAIKDASFLIKKGEFVFLVGPSGAGKSTLLKMIYKAEVPTTGTISIFERNLKKIRTSLLRRNIGVVFQDFQLLPQKTAYENVAYVLAILGKSPSFIKEKTMKALTRMGIEEHANKYPHQMSGGEQQRIAIARAIVNEPEILICDEPTGNLDSDNTWIIMNYLNELNRQGTTIVVSTHDELVIEKMEKRIIEVENGRVKTEPVWI